MPMYKNERLTLAGLHRTIGFSLMCDKPVPFCCPIGSECGQYKYCLMCDAFISDIEESEAHDACWWMNELKKYKEYMRNGRDFENY